MMAQQRVLQFEHRQSQVHESDRPGWSERVTVSVRLLSEALTSGWYRQQFGSRGNDFIVLVAIAMHAHPLNGDELRLLERLGMVTAADAGRLYARVTLLGLAAELGLNTRTVRRAVEHLTAAQLVQAVEIPAQAREFYEAWGSFHGVQVFLLGGDLERHFLEKSVEKTEESQIQPGMTGRATAVTKVQPGATDLPINKIQEEEEEEDSFSPLPVGEGPGVRESSPPRPGDPPPRAEGPGVRETSPPCPGDLPPRAEGLALQETSPPRPSDPPPRAEGLAVRETSPPRPDTSPPSDEPPDPQLAWTVELYASGGRQVTPDVLTRFRWMAARSDPAARAAGASGWAWLEEALGMALGVAQPANVLGYAEKVLQDWIAHGHPLPPEAPRARSKKGRAHPPRPPTADPGEPAGYAGIRAYLEQSGGKLDGM